MRHETSLLTQTGLTGADDGRRISAESADWRCRKCRLCLGRTQQGAADIVYKDLQILFLGRGVLVERCRRCGEINRIEIGEYAPTS